MAKGRILFFAKCGYDVTAFDISVQGIEKAKRLAEYNKVDVRFFKADLFDYRPDTEYDIIFSSGVLHFISQTERKELCDSLKTHTTDNGINALNVFVKKLLFHVLQIVQGMKKKTSMVFRRVIWIL